MSGTPERQRYPRFTRRPAEPVVVEALLYDGTNDAEITAFVERDGGEVIEWIGSDRWVSFDGNYEGFPLPPGHWVTRGSEPGQFGLYDAEEFEHSFHSAPGYLEAKSKLNEKE